MEKDNKKEEEEKNRNEEVSDEEEKLSLDDEMEVKEKRTQGCHGHILARTVNRAQQGAI